MSYIRFGYARRLAFELEAVSWGRGAGRTTEARENGAWRRLATQIDRLEAEIVQLRREATPVLLRESDDALDPLTYVAPPLS